MPANDEHSGAEVDDFDTAPGSDTTFDAEVLHAPHNIPSDGSSNPAFTSGTNSHTQYPFAELNARGGNSA